MLALAVTVTGCDVNRSDLVLVAIVKFALVENAGIITLDGTMIFVLLLLNDTTILTDTARGIRTVPVVV